MFMRYRQQFDESDCGAACLAMIASFFGLNLNIAEIRNQAGTNIEGTSFNGLLEAAHYYGLRARAVKGEISALDKNLPVPFIVFIKKKKDGKLINHFVVVRKIYKKKIEIWDPDPIEKKKRISRESFSKYWTNYALFFEPNTEFKENARKDNILIKFLPIFLPHKKNLVYSFCASLLLLFLGLISSFYFKYIFDEVIFSEAKLSLHAFSFGVLFIVIIQNVINSIRSVFLSHISYKSDLQLSFSYLSHIFKLPLSFFETRKNGEIISRLNDLSKVQNTISNIALSSVMDIIMIMVSAPFLLKISSFLFSISFFTVLLASLIAFIFSGIYKKFYSKAMSERAEVDSFLYEAISGVSTIKAFNSEETIFYNFEKKKMKSVDTLWKVNSFRITQTLLSGIINGVSGILIYWIGSLQIMEGNLSFGALIAFNSLLGYFTAPLFRLLNIQNSIQESLVAAKRVGEVLELEKEKGFEGNKFLKIDQQFDIEFQNVSFGYGKEYLVFENLNLKIEKGSWTAIVGPSGSGKSTLVKLLVKFYNIKSGRILVNNSDIRDIDTKSLRKIIGYVPQDIFLISGTIRENISLHYPEASLTEVIDAAKKAGAYEFIEKLPERFETKIGEHGIGFSGGEKQKIALARALLKTPKLLIFDEATSNLDTISERQICNVVQELRKEQVTVIVIAHRISSIKECDKIIVLDQGKNVEEGNHSELLKMNGIYKKLWNEQK